MNEVLKNIKARHSVRAYTDQQVSLEDLKLILDAGVCAPSGMHLETWHFTAIQNAETLNTLNEKIKAAFAKSDDPRLKERGHSSTYCCYYHAPTLVIVSGDADNRFSPLDCACALENIFLAATSLGIGSCWINQLGQTCDDADVRAYLTELGVPANYKVVGCAALGYAPADAPAKEKKVKENIVTIIR
ncbi:MAG: nitroreductase [Bacteroides sp.]|nr:nitroreductase [Bacteroides sp.]